MDLNQMAMSAFRRAQYKYGDDAACYVPPKLLEDDLNEILQSDHFKNWSYENEIVNDALVVKHIGIQEGYGDDN